MQLSEALVLGDPLKRSDSNVWLNADGSCGCAFGGALLAAGLATNYIAERHKHWDPSHFFNLEPYESKTVMAVWPWLTKEILLEISRKYTAVCRGEGTIEDVAAYVRSVEPAEQSSTNCLDISEPVEVA